MYRCDAAHAATTGPRRPAKCTEAMRLTTTGSASVALVNGNGPAKCSQPSLAANTRATASVTGSRVPAQPRDESRRHAAVQHTGKTHVPLELRHENNETKVDRCGRSEHDETPATATELRGEQPPHKCRASEVPCQVSGIRVHQVPAQQAPGLPREHRGALVAQALRHLRAGQPQSDQQQAEARSRAPVRIASCGDTRAHAQPGVRCRHLL